MLSGLEVAALTDSCTVVWNSSRRAEGADVLALHRTDVIHTLRGNMSLNQKYIKSQRHGNCENT